MYLVVFLLAIVYQRMCTWRVKKKIDKAKQKAKQNTGQAHVSMACGKESHPLLDQSASPWSSTSSGASCQTASRGPSWARDGTESHVNLSSHLRMGRRQDDPKKKRKALSTLRVQRGRAGWPCPEKVCWVEDCYASSPYLASFIF